MTNHPINDSTIGHTSSRRPNKVEKERIANLGSKGVKPAQIMSILKDEGGNENISLTDINNHLYKSRQDFLKGRTIMEALIDSLTTDMWYGFKITSQLEFSLQIAIPAS